MTSTAFDAPSSEWSWGSRMKVPSSNSCSSELREVLEPDAQPWRFERLYTAWKQASAGKRRRPDVSNYEFRLGERLAGLSERLEQLSWQPGGYRSFERVERGKRRLISAAPFEDRIVHHALVNQLAPWWERRFLNWSCANRVGRGTHFAMALARNAAMRCRWVLQLDVSRFFPSIDHDVLTRLLAASMPNARVAALWCRVIASGAEVFPNLARPALAAGDDLLSLTGPKGLPIGNQTSQFLANVVLHPLDVAVATVVKPMAAVRYVDDLVLFDDDRRRLEAAASTLSAALAGLRLRFAARKTRLVAVREGFTFVGYRLTHCSARLPRATLSRWHTGLHELQRQYASGLSFERARASVAGLAGHARPAGCEAVLGQLLEGHPLTRGA